ncbi:MAG: hypothetical protein JXE07_01470 [Candidatus Aminicenantes bacterium]|nr:hypothetical protein [Candidatus Aminicenantes bacterium]
MGEERPLGRSREDVLKREPARLIQKIAQVRSEYTSARLICSNLEHRAAGTRFERAPGYLPAEIDYIATDSASGTLCVRDYDVRYLDRVSVGEASEHLESILRARRGDERARQKLERRTRETWRRISARFAGTSLIETDEVIPYTTSREFSQAQISNKGSILLDLSGHGFATADFCLLAAGAYLLRPEWLERCLKDTIRNLEILSGRRLEDPKNPLLIAMRSAMPEYLPGFMPTYLNVGLTPAMFSGLPERYGREASIKIRLSNRKTILEALDPDAFRDIEGKIHPGRTTEENIDLIGSIESLIEQHDPGLLISAHKQMRFFLAKTYAYYESQLDALRNFMVRETHYPAIIFQRMVCSVIDRNSYAGVLYSRHPRLGTGVLLQFARTVYGEDLMTGRVPAVERHFQSREETRAEFPAVYHFWNRLFQLEEVFRGPVMVEFTGVHGTFTILQVNPAELTGAGMITAVMDMHRSEKISAERVRELVKPYHVRQIESDAIDPKSLGTLALFGRGLSVLPRSAVSGRVFFSIGEAKASGTGEKVILVKERFNPQDAVDMQKVSAICSFSPAAIHVVTAAQNLGIPALLNLEEDGVRMNQSDRSLVNREGLAIKEADWVTVSSRGKALYVGKASFAPARLLRFMAGLSVDLTSGERARFERLAFYYREYRKILESVDAMAFESLQDLGHSILYGRFRENPSGAAALANQCFDVNREKLTRRLLEVTLGTHLMNQAAYRLLTPDRQIQLLKDALALCRDRGISGYQAGAFVIGNLVRPESPIAFWQAFTPSEIGGLINEWVLHQKYTNILNDVGERKISRARTYILSRGLMSLRIHHGMVREFMPLKLSRISLDEVRQALPGNIDSQTVKVLDLLAQPYGNFYAFDHPGSVARLKKICDAERVALPKPEDI